MVINIKGIIKKVTPTKTRASHLFSEQILENFSAKVTGKVLKIAVIKTIPKILNIKWLKATDMATASDVTRAASIAVMVVPIFVPKV